MKCIEEDIEEVNLFDDDEDDSIERRYRSVICCNCSIPTTHKLVTGLGCYPNYHESPVCNMCSDLIQKLNNYELDYHGIIGVYKLT